MTDPAVDQTWLKAAFESDGFASLDQLLGRDEVGRYAALYDRFLDGTISTGRLRSDLGAGSDESVKGQENITQIMWPSELVPVLTDTPAHTRTLALAKAMMGEDMAFDFDMLIDKPPLSNTPTPWHQDCAYWPSLPDQRALSVWIALDEATLENGCMWFVPGSHRLPVRPHRPAGRGGGAIECDGAEEEGVPVPVVPGGCTFHDGRTLHYSRGNTTGGHRRAMILNFRPEKMIRLEREHGYDHGRSHNVRAVRNQAAKEV